MKYPSNIKSELIIRSRRRIPRGEQKWRHHIDITITTTI
jgi:hypothetical protein